MEGEISARAVKGRTAIRALAKIMNEGEECVHGDKGRSKEYHSTANNDIGI